MEIIIVDNELYQVCECKSDKELKEKITHCICDYLKSLFIDKTVIRNIIISDMKKSNGRIDIINYYPLSFDMFLNSNVIWRLFDKSQNKEDYASGIIIHELFHCKDISIANSILNISNILEHSPSLNELYMDLGLHQWSEYYAHYNSAKIYPSDILIHASEPENIIESIGIFVLNGLYGDNPTNYMIYNNTIHPFIRKVIILLANINSISSQPHINELERYKSISNHMNEYIQNVDITLTQYLKTYPDFISEKSFLKLGEILLNI